MKGKTKFSILRNHKKDIKESVEREKIKTDFIFTISHELRTPLNIITNSSKLIKSKINKNEYEKELFLRQINLIEKNSNRLLRLANNLIDVSKIESGFLDVSFKNQNIVEVVEDTVMSAIDVSKSYGIELIFDTEEEEIITAIDRNQIEKIILNLISNSIKFTDSGGHIYVSIEKDEEYILIKVKDDGIGMNDELINHMFEKFRKAKLYPSLERATEGSGLGLYIVKGLVEKHNGIIDIKSEINRGTTVIIKLPQSFVDKENSNQNLMNIPLEYTSKIELSDIYKEYD
ncbi:MAG: HAMP domain-containing histidine kinase [Romboutsia sp.]|nr:HAMP domain-containing histidine kinase [Romboutsia sp.]